MISDPLIPGISLDFPFYRNALSMDMLHDILGDLTRNLEDKSLRVIVLSATESPVFSAGHNLKELVRNLVDELNLSYSIAVFRHQKMVRIFTGKSLNYVIVL